MTEFPLGFCMNATWRISGRVDVISARRLAIFRHKAGIALFSDGIAVVA